MRASMKAIGGNRGAASPVSIHISGAEGIYGEAEISNICSEFMTRAFSHPRGRPDKVVITIEEIIERPIKAPLLPIKALACASPEEAWELIRQYLMELGVSGKALKTAFKVVTSENAMRGAAIVTVRTGKRMEPDRIRGVRVSRLGIEAKSRVKLSRRLSRMHINSPTVKEALVLASKVASCQDVIAEMCISDNPDYTTGYLASRTLGYLRISNIKNPGGMNGGRVFFVSDDADIDKVVAWLERKPVILEFGND
jgi:6-carboxyhexanoate--CoA ligase